MSHCSNCSGCSNCGGCGGCTGPIELTPGELTILQALAQYPFLPIGRQPWEEVPTCLEFPEFSPQETSLFLQCLEKRGLITLDYDQPLSGFDYSPYPRLHGSLALTARGQQAADSMDILGIG